MAQKSSNVIIKFKDGDYQPFVPLIQTKYNVTTNISECVSRKLIFNKLMIDLEKYRLK